MIIMKKKSMVTPPLVTMTPSLFWAMFFVLTLNVASMFVVVGGQEEQQFITYRDTPVKIWEARIPSVRKGNGVFLSDSDSSNEPTTLVSTSQDGSIFGFHPASGTNWSYRPIIDGGSIPTTVSSTSGMTFVAPTTTKTDNLQNTIDYNYMIYSIMENENSAKPMTRVVALDMNGQELWISSQLEGVSSTPVASEDGNFVFLTHNSDFESVGHFTILDSRNNGTVLFTQTNGTNPFAPLGIYHNPQPEGNFEGGEKNKNDLIVWSIKPKFDDATVGKGATFAFQFPIDYDFTANPVDADAVDAMNMTDSQQRQLTYTQLGELRDFQSIVKPVFANGGLSMYFSTTRSQFRCWLGQAGLKRFRFNLPRYATVGFTRGSPPGQAVFAPLALSSHSDSAPRVFGGTASAEFVALNHDFTEQVVVKTLSTVQSQAHVSPDNLYVYYVEFNGQIHQANFDDLTDRWVEDLRVPVEGEFALSKDGSTLFVADVTGFLHAYAVGDPDSQSPSVPPSDIPSDSPSYGPTSSPALITDFPTMQPVKSNPTITSTTLPPSLGSVDSKAPKSGSIQLSMLMTLKFATLAVALINLI